MLDCSASCTPNPPISPRPGKDSCRSISNTPGLLPASSHAEPFSPRLPPPPVPGSQPRCPGNLSAHGAALSTELTPALSPLPSVPQGAGAAGAAALKAAGHRGRHPAVKTNFVPRKLPTSEQAAPRRARSSSPQPLSTAARCNPALPRRPASLLERRAPRSGRRAGAERDRRPPTRSPRTLPSARGPSPARPSRGAVRGGAVRRGAVRGCRARGASCGGFPEGRGAASLTRGGGREPGGVNALLQPGGAAQGCSSPPGLSEVGVCGES